MFFLNLPITQTVANERQTLSDFIDIKTGLSGRED
jgi:hypothetical protein